MPACLVWGRAACVDWLASPDRGVRLCRFPVRVDVLAPPTPGPGLASAHHVAPRRVRAFQTYLEGRYPGPRPSPPLDARLGCLPPPAEPIGLWGRPSSVGARPP